MIKNIYAVWVYVKDIWESKKFYEEILGLKCTFQEGGWLEFDLGGTSFAILKRPKEKDPEVKPEKTRIMFQVDNLANMKERLESHDVKIIQVKNEDYGKLLTFEDPNGHWLELFEHN